MTAGVPTLQIVKRTGSRPFPPRISAFSRPFWEALATGRLISTSCNACRRLSFPPKPICRGCWSEDIAWRDLASRGTLYSYTRIHVLPRAFVDDGLNDIGIIDLTDGVRLMCRLIGDGDEFQADMEMVMVILMYDDGPLFAAKPARQ